MLLRELISMELSLPIIKVSHVKIFEVMFFKDATPLFLKRCPIFNRSNAFSHYQGWMPGVGSAVIKVGCDHVNSRSMIIPSSSGTCDQIQRIMEGTNPPLLLTLVNRDALVKLDTLTMVSLPPSVSLLYKVTAAARQGNWNLSR